VEDKALLRRHALFPCLGVIAVYLAEDLQHKPAWLGKIRCHLYEIPPAVRVIWCSR